MARETGAAVIVEWAVILLIGIFVLPQLLNVLFAGVSGLGRSARSAVLSTDPFAAADAALARDIYNMR